MKNLTRLTYLSIFVAFHCSVVSQVCDFTLRGQVNDEDNQEHLGYSILKLHPKDTVVQADDHGNFIFPGLCAGNYQLFVSHVGCRDTVIPVILKGSSRIVITLPHSLTALGDVDVNADHAEERPAQTADILNKDELLKVSGENLARQLERAPGVRVLASGPTIAKPMVNGLQGYRVLTMNNGVRLEGQQWGTEHAPEIDPYTAGKIMVVSGASAVRYGSDAIGGVILVEPEELPDTASITGEVNVSYETNGRMHTQAARLQGYFDKLKYFSWRVQGSQRNGGNVAAGGGDFLDNTGLREKSFSYIIDYHRKNGGVSVYYSQFNAENGIYSGAHFGNLTDLQAVINGERSLDSASGFSRGIGGPYQVVSHELIKAESDIHTGPRSRINFNYANQYNHRREFDEHDHEHHGEPDGGEEAAADYRLLTESAELSWEHDYIRAWRGKFGVQGMRQRNAGTGLTLMPNFTTSNFGLFAVEKFVRPHYELEAGVRYDSRVQRAWFFEGDSLVNPALSFDNLSGSLGGVFRHEWVRLTINVANAWRAPAMNELYGNGLHHGVAAIERGNQTLDKEHGISLTGSGIFNFRTVALQMSQYQYWFDNFIYYMPSLTHELTVRGAFPVFSYTQAAARIQGADARFDWQFAPFLKLRAGGAWIRGSTGDGRPILNIPATRYDFSFIFSPRINRLRNVFFEPSVSITEKQKRFLPGTDFAGPPPGYFLVNFDAGVSIPAWGHEIVLQISAKNLLDSRYRDYLDRFRYYTFSAGRSFVFRARLPLTLFDKKK